MTIKFEFDGKRAGAQFQQAMGRKYGRMADATRDAANRVAEDIKTQGDADILGAGKFTKRWTDSFRVLLEPARGRTINILIRAVSSIPYFMIHERGGVIKGRPLLWIPLPWTGLRMRARDYPGSLFRVDREAKNPLLLDYATGEPKYVGVESVTLRKRFHIGRIIRNAAKRTGAYYRAAYRQRR